MVTSEAFLDAVLAAEPTGRGFGGVSASRSAAKNDAWRAMAIGERFKHHYNVPPCLLMAIASRESRIGNALDNRGYGDGGNAYGIMQIDKRHHDIDAREGPLGVPHISSAASILAKNVGGVRKKHPRWRNRFVIQGAIAAYNFGVSNVQTIEGVDIGTTGNDYSNDVLARAMFFFDWIY